MILEKYQHVQTPKAILDFLEGVANEKEKAFQQMDYREYVASTANPYQFLKDSIRFRHELGKKTNVIPFRTYFPTFQTLDPYRKDFYFYWRSEAVKGNFLPTELSYIFLFVYELVNYGFSADASFNISMLERLYREYVYRYPKLENYLPNWMADFLLEAGESVLASEWLTGDKKENKDYYELKTYDENLKNMSMNSWWKYVTERSRSPFFTRHKQKIYNTFKEATYFLHMQYKELEGEGILEKIFPLQTVVLPRQLYVGCLMERHVSFENLMVERRLFDPTYGLFLSELMRVCENVVRKNANEEALLTIRYERISEELEKMIMEHMELIERNGRFKKVSNGMTADKGAPIPPLEEAVMEIKLDFERIETLRDASDEFQKLYEEKYGDENIQDETEEENKREERNTVSALTPADLPLFPTETDEDVEGFVEALSAIEKEFLLLYRRTPLTVEETKRFLKEKGLMFGTFLIDLNEKAEEYLGDVLLEEEADAVILTEEFTFILNKL